jgi:hypothetical protein
MARTAVQPAARFRDEAVRKTAMNPKMKPPITALMNASWRKTSIIISGVMSGPV